MAAEVLMSNRRVKNVKFLIFIAVIIVFFMRPFSLGLNNSVVSNLALLSVSFIINLSVPHTLKNGSKIFGIVFVFYLINIVSLFILNGSLGFTSFAQLFQAVAVFLLFQNEEVMQCFFKYLKNIFIVLCILGIINFLLESIYEPDELILLKELEYDNGIYYFNLYFPLSWSRLIWLIPGDSFFSGEHIRQYYFFIEPGMVPTFFTAMIFIILANPKEKAKIFKITILVIGMFLTFSLGGVVILFSALGVYFFLGIKGKGKNKFLMLLLAVGLAFVTWYAYNYMPIFGKAARMEFGTQSVESLETHENVVQFVLLSTAILCLLGLVLSKFKNNKRCYLTIVFILAVGYLSNYVGFTTLATIFTFWDLPYKSTTLSERLLASRHHLSLEK